MKSLYRTLALAIFGILFTTAEAHIYRPGTYKSKSTTRSEFKVAGCAPATAVAQLHFNGVRARIENGGTLWMDRGSSTPAYFVPGDGNISPIFAGALWMGGKSPNGQLKLAAVRFRQGNDFFPGPLSKESAEIEAEICDQWDKIFEISKREAAQHKSYYDAIAYDNINGTSTVLELFPDGYSAPKSITEWPAHGDVTLGQYRILAPFVDNPDAGDEGFYEPEVGDYPGYDLFGTRDCRAQPENVPLFGDKTYYWIFNDKGNVHTETGSQPIGMEIRAQAFAFADNTEINNMTFYNYVLINQGSQTLTDTYFGQWVDADLGNPLDDYVGCDVQRGLGYCYNGDDDDDVTGGPSPGYGINPPAIGVDFFEGPFQDKDEKDNVGPYKEVTAEEGVPVDEMNYNIAKSDDGIPYGGLGIGYGDGIADNERFGMRKFLFHNNATGDLGDPSTGEHYYNYLNGIWKDNQPFIYGGNAHDESTGADPNVICDYMFPGDSDPLGWGTSGNTAVPEWTETTANNAPEDRRFMQSAGPFTLRPGAVNNITVGVVFAKASSGGALASLDALRIADDKAQALFDGCFQILEGPDAPTVTIRELENELILSLTNPQSSNNYLEEYDKLDPEIPFGDKTYNFEGYLIYQVKDATVSVADLDNVNLSRLAFQVDIENFETDSAGNVNLDRPIDQLVNYEFDEEIKLAVPSLKVNGANKGIQHTFRVTQDLFTTSASKTLVNNKPYYFIAIAYGYNNYAPFTTGEEGFTGQATQFLASRKAGTGGSIRPVSGIPHQIDNQDGGTAINSEYGGEFVVTAVEGMGNGGRHVELSSETIEEIMSGAPWRADEVTYEKGFGPIDVKVVDPIAVKAADFTLRFIAPEEPFSGLSNESKWAEYMADCTWELTDHSTNTVITSTSSIDLGNEEFLIDYGISIKIDQYKAVNFSISQSENEYGLPIFSSIEFEDPSDMWLFGVPDAEGENPLNWIRSGMATDTTLSFRDEENADPEEEFERLVGGTWTAARVAGNHNEGPLPNQTNWFKDRDRKTSYNSSVDIVITKDRSKWSRVPVIEMCPDPSLAQGGAEKGKLRNAPSLDINGQPSAAGAMTAGQSTPTGMSWFPGYAIDLETGERLNMAFGENSFIRGENGDDMLWNPGSEVVAGLGGSVKGGGFHFVYVFRNQNRVLQEDDGVSSYDEGLSLWTLFNKDNTGGYRDIWTALMWVGWPLTAPGVEMDINGDFIPNDVTVKIRMKKPYIRKAHNEHRDWSDLTGAENDWYPLFKFNTYDEVATVGDASIVKNNLDKIQVVPNPYYAYSEYEADRLDTRVKFTALPQKCTISIYHVNGTLIRRITKDNSSTIVEWDLKNEKTIPVSSGVYLIHIEVPGVGERVIKWFAIMRQVDLENL